MPSDVRKVFDLPSGSRIILGCALLLGRSPEVIAQVSVGHSHHRTSDGKAAGHPPDKN